MEMDINNLSKFLNLENQNSIRNQKTDNKSAIFKNKTNYQRDNSVENIQNKTIVKNEIFAVSKNQDINFKKSNN